MPKAIVCMDKNLRKSIVALLRDSGADDDVVKNFNKLSACDGGEMVGFGRGGKGSGGKRKPSEYNAYIGRCVKGGKDFKQCAQAWSAKKGR